MRRIDCPDIRDDFLLAALATSKSPGAQGLSPFEEPMLARYDAYAKHRGNPWSLDVDKSFLPYKKILMALYESPPLVLSFIAGMRESLSGACPVCGGEALGTLDHYLPKSSYAEYSFYSKNLIPSCSRCNTGRNNLVKGAVPGERPVHPYFDTFAGERVLTIKFEPDWRAPRLSPVACGVSGEDLITVQWHIDNVIKPAGIIRYLVGFWDAVISNARFYFCDAQNIEDLMRAAERNEKYEALSSHSSNAWRSAFFHGLKSNIPALEYINSLIR